MRRRLTGSFDHIFRGFRHRSQQATQEWSRWWGWAVWSSSSLLRSRRWYVVSAVRGVWLGLGSAGPAVNLSRQYPSSALVLRSLMGGIGRPARSLLFLWREAVVIPC